MLGRFIIGNGKTRYRTLKSRSIFERNSRTNTVCGVLWFDDLSDAKTAEEDKKQVLDDDEMMKAEVQEGYNPNRLGYLQISYFATEQSQWSK